MRFWNRLVVAAWLVSAAASVPAQTADPLPSWNDTGPKEAIVAFIERITRPGADLVPVPERIAVFDNDGTLWPENAMPVQAAFALDEVRRRVAEEPALAADPMVKALLSSDVATLLAGKHHDGLMRIAALPLAGMTVDEFNARVSSWMTTARHPRAC